VETLEHGHFFEERSELWRARGSARLISATAKLLEERRNAEIVHRSSFGQAEPFQALGRRICRNGAKSATSIMRDPSLFGVTCHDKTPNG
jgi:hypothetical protein